MANTMKNAIMEPDAKEQNGVIFFDQPWDVPLEDWYSIHDESDFIADELSDHRVRVYCYAKNGMYNPELERVAQTMYPQKVIYNGMGISFGSIWL